MVLLFFGSFFNRGFIYCYIAFWWWSWIVYVCGLSWICAKDENWYKYEKYMETHKDSFHLLTNKYKNVRFIWQSFHKKEAKHIKIIKSYLFTLITNFDDFLSTITLINSFAFSCWLAFSNTKFSRLVFVRRILIFLST